MYFKWKTQQKNMSMKGSLRKLFINMVIDRDIFKNNRNTLFLCFTYSKQ